MVANLLRFLERVNGVLSLEIGNNSGSTAMDSARVAEHHAERRGSMTSADRILLAHPVISRSSRPRLAGGGWQAVAGAAGMAGAPRSKQAAGPAGPP